MNFELPEMAKNWSFGLFRPNLPLFGLFHPYFVWKSSFRVISMIQMVILDQSKPILLIFGKKKFYIARLLFVKTEIRQVYNPFYNRILHLLCSIIFFGRWRVKKLSTGGGPGACLEKVLISAWLVTLLHICGVNTNSAITDIARSSTPMSLETPRERRCCRASANVAVPSADVSASSADIIASNGECLSILWCFTMF